MFDRFTDRAKKVMNLSRMEAQRFNHEYLGTEHILLGLVHEGSGVAANVLKQMGIDLNKLRLEVEKIVRTGPTMVTMGQLPFTPRAKKVLELSLEEAGNLGLNYIGTEALLLGLVKENEGIAAQVLMNLGVKLEDVRLEVIDFLGVDPPGEVEEQERESESAAGLRRFMSETMPWVQLGGLAGIDATQLEYLEARLRADPTIRSLNLEIEELELLKDKYVESQDFEQAARSREMAYKLKKRAEQLVKDLKRAARTQPGPIEGGLLDRFTVRVHPSACTPIRPLELRELHDRIASGSPVLLVGEPGCGRASLVEGLAAHYAGLPEVAPIRRMLKPNHLALEHGGGPDAYHDNALRLCEELEAASRVLLFVPDLHILLDPQREEMFRIWKGVLGSLLGADRPFLATADPEGLRRLRDRVPGMLERLELMELAPPAEEAVLALLERAMVEYTARCGIEFAPGISRAVYARRAEWRALDALADPGRSLALLEALTSYGQACTGSPHLDADRIEQRRRLRRGLQRAVQLDQYEEARRLMDELQTLEAQVPPTLDAAEPGVIRSELLDEFLRGQDA